MIASAKISQIPKILLMTDACRIAMEANDIYQWTTEYPSEQAFENTKNYYIHRLAVHPKHQGKGFAQRLMDFGENFARENNGLSVRLDTFSQNKRNQKFYEQRGYAKLGDIFFPNQSEHPFHCYELVL